MKDSYQAFFSKGYISKEQFYQFGLEESIYIDHCQARFAWDRLKNDVLSNKQVYIRGYGRNGSGTDLFKALYQFILGNQYIKEDPTNNAIPERVLNENTKFRKNIGRDTSTFEKIQNYQISHIFGKTKNPFLFAAPWNIAYIPKIIDPFTGHEARGDMPAEYSKLFRMKAFELFGDMIDDYNNLISKIDLRERANMYINNLEEEKTLDQTRICKFKEDVNNELTQIIREN
ncbi:hypothetical protein [Paenibacillus sp. KN14-4R]|uniref:hypothetical protein n=1 Tax=Paenibacillus sp. KN14-4R TaxID=3445773 RepID=UPI003FA14AA5